MSALAATLVLRDVQLPAAPSWWPPAPGWWLLAVGLLLVLGVLAGWQLRRWRQARYWARHFDRTLAAASGPLEQVRLASELLRRAALVHDAAAASLDGGAWRQWLQAGQSRVSAAAVEVLAEGSFQPALAPAQAAAACALARARFVATMVGR